MKAITKLTIFLLFGLLSCNNSNKANQRLVKDEILNKKTINKQQSVNNFSKNQLKSNRDYSKLIFNKKLIPLSIIKKDSTDKYEKYQIDFYAVCMCDSNSILIDDKNKKLIIYEYCFGNMPYNNKKATSFQIKSINKINELIRIHLKSDKEKLYLEISENTDQKIYNINIMGSNPYLTRLKDYKFFTFLSDQINFSKEDCEDFDG